MRNHQKTRFTCCFGSLIDISNMRPLLSSVGPLYAIAPVSGWRFSMWLPIIAPDSERHSVAISLLLDCCRYTCELYPQRCAAASSTAVGGSASWYSVAVSTAHATGDGVWSGGHWCHHDNGVQHELVSNTRTFGLAFVDPRRHLFSLRQRTPVHSPRVNTLGVYFRSVNDGCASLLLVARIYWLVSQRNCSGSLLA